MAGALGRVSHVFFDMDGLLLDTEPIYTQVHQKMLDPVGKEFGWECKSRQMGRPKRDAGQVFIDFYGLDMSVDDYVEQSNALIDQLMPSAQLLPGAERLVRHLSASSVPMAVATGSTSAHFGLKTSRHRDLFRLFHHVVCSDDAELARGKPHPDIFLLAAERFRTPSHSREAKSHSQETKEAPPMSSVLVFEDAPNGVEAALAAGAKVLMVPDPRVPKDVRDKATLAIDSLEDFDPAVFGLPAF